MNSAPHKRKRTMSPAQWRDLRSGLLFISPWIVGFVLFLAYPIGMSFYYSLCDFSVLQPPQFVGLSNYQQLLTDDVFRQSLGNTLYYASFSIPLAIMLALAIAMLLNSKVEGMAVYRTVYYLPSMVPQVAVAMLWLWLFNGEYGILNFALKEIPIGRFMVWLTLLSPLLLGLLFGTFARASDKSKWLRRCAGAIAGLALIGAFLATGQFRELPHLTINPPNWLGTAEWVKPAFVLTALWGSGNAMVIYLAGLQDVPQHLYEAADLDGANWWQKTLHVTIPMISPVILFNSIMAIIQTFNYFTIPYIMAPGGQPARSAYFLAVNLFDNAFQYLRMGYASAMGWILFIIVFLLTLLALKISERHVHYAE